MRPAIACALLATALNGCIRIPITNDGAWKSINGGDASISGERRETLRRYLKLDPSSPEAVDLANGLGQGGDNALVASMAQLHGKRRVYPVMFFPVSHDGTPHGVVDFFTKTNPYEEHANRVVAAIRNPAAAPALRDLVARGTMRVSALKALKASGVPLLDSEYQALLREAGRYEDWDGLIDEVKALPPDRANKIFLSYLRPELIHHQTAAPSGRLSVGRLVACGPSSSDKDTHAGAMSAEAPVFPLTDLEFERLKRILGSIKRLGSERCVAENLPALSAARQAERERASSTASNAANYPEALSGKTKRAGEQLDYLIAEIQAMR